MLYKVALLGFCALSLVCGPAVNQVAPRKEKPVNLAFVLLSQAQMPEAEQIVRAFGAYAPTDQRLRLRGNEAGKQILEFEISPSGTAFVALMPLAVPKGEADDAVRFSVSALGTGWKLPSHKAHLMVNLRDAETQSHIETLSRFTSLLAAVAEASQAVGIYWGNAGATHDPKFFMSIARERDLVSQIMLWTGVSIARDDNGRLSLLSLGMKQLNLPDLLLTAPKSAGNTALATFFDFLVYVANLGKPIPEGDTVGRTANERLAVHYVPSPIDPNTKVWRVDLK